jgi:hypothetical protein
MDPASVGIGILAADLERFSDELRDAAPSSHQPRRTARSDGTTTPMVGRRLAHSLAQERHATGPKRGREPSAVPVAPCGEDHVRPRTVDH